MDINAFSQLSQKSGTQAPQPRHSLVAGLMNSNGGWRPTVGGNRNAGGPVGAGGLGGAISMPAPGLGAVAPDFQELVAMAQAQAEMATRGGAGGAASQEALRNLTQMRALSMESDMLSSLSGLESPQGQNGEGAGNMVEQMNFEALMSSGDFGNLLGLPEVRAALDTAENGRTFTPEQMDAWRESHNPSRPRSAAMRSAALKFASVSNLPQPTELGRAPERCHLGEAALSAVTMARAEGARVEGQILAEAKAKAEIAAAAAAQVKAEAEAKAKAEAEAAAAAKAKTKEARSKKRDPLKDADVVVTARKKTESAPATGDKVTMERLDRLVDKVSLALGLDANLVKAVIKTESNFNHRAVSSAGAQGLMQLMPGTARDLGVQDPFNPVENVWAGARYLKKMLDRHNGNINKALASYNWGPGNVDRYGGGGHLPGETRRYIAVVNKHYAKFKSDDDASA